MKRSRLRKSTNLTQFFIMQPDDAGGLEIHIISFFLDASRLQSKKKLVIVRSFLKIHRLSLQNRL